MTISFKEQADHERGFSALWDRHVPPDFNVYRETFYKIGRKGRATMLVGVVATIAAFLFFGRFGPAIFLFPIVAVAAFFFTLRSYAPLFRAQKEMSEKFLTALNEHFSDRVVPLKRRSAMQDIFDELADEGMAPRDPAIIGASYGAIDSEFVFFNATVKRETTSMTRDENDQPNNRTFTYQHFLVVQMRLDTNCSTPIRVTPDSKLGNMFTKLTKDWSRVEMDNAAFEKNFEVYCDDVGVAKAVFTEAVQGAFASMREYYSRNRPRLKGKLRIHCLIKAEHMTLIFDDLDDVSGAKLTGRTPEKLVDAAHAGLARMAETIKIVDTYRDLIPILR